jgi:hypothetical protein
VSLHLSTNREARSSRSSTTELRLRDEAKLYPLVSLVRFCSIQPAPSVRYRAKDLSGGHRALMTHPARGSSIGQPALKALKDLQRSPRPLPRPEDRLAASSLAARPSGLSRQPRRSQRPKRRLIPREPRLRGPPEPLSAPSALDDPPKRLASTSWQRFGTQEVEGVSLGMRAAAWLRRATRRGASNLPTFSEPDSWHRANLCTRRYMVGGGAGPELQGVQKPLQSLAATQRVAPRNHD